MVFHGGYVEKATLFMLVLFCYQVCGGKKINIDSTQIKNGVTQDQYSTRANTLFDNVDDTQRQLNNEVRERLGRPPTVWVLHIPTRFPMLNIDVDSPQLSTPNNLALRLRRHKASKKNKHKKEKSKDVTIVTVRSTNEPCHCYCNECECQKQATSNWDFNTQDKWYQSFPSCGGRSQSPVNLPVKGLIHAHGARKILFRNYNQMPLSLRLVNDGKTVTLTGKWKREQWPLVYGGAAHSRRYLFHSMTFYWPSEHSVGTFHYPLESQVLHVSAEYGSFEEAVAATNDPQAFLGVINIYKYGASTQPGTVQVIQAALKSLGGSSSVAVKPAPLSCFSPPFKEYVCYQNSQSAFVFIKGSFSFLRQGSLTTPPCTESVLWLARRRSLPLTRKAAIALKSIAAGSFEKAQKTMVRHPQPLNDRRVFLFL